MNDEQIKAKVKEFYDSFFNMMCGGLGRHTAFAQTFKGPAMEAASRIVTQMVVDLGYKQG